jgi:hypothetical protein
MQAADIDLPLPTEKPNQLYLSLTNQREVNAFIDRYLAMNRFSTSVKNRVAVADAIKAYAHGHTIRKYEITAHLDSIFKKK